MIFNWREWVLPGILFVTIITAIAVFSTSQRVEQDLSSKVLKDLETNHPWADVKVDGRDLTLGGVAPSASAVDETMEIARGPYGIRLVRDATELLPVVSPFNFSIELKSDGIDLAGHIPDENARADLIRKLSEIHPSLIIEDETKPARGAPSGFSELSGFMINQLSNLQTGSASLSDENITFSGKANSLEAYENIRAAITGNLPGNGKLALAEIEPFDVAPYVWNIKREDQTVSISGYSPNEVAKTAIGDSSRSAFPEAELNNELRVAAGAPDNFKGVTQFAIDLMQLFSNGEITVSDQTMNVAGQTTSSENFERAVAKLQSLPSGYTLGDNSIDPPIASNYNWKAVKNEGRIELSGFAPTPEIRQGVLDLARRISPETEIVSEMKIAAGAPDEYPSIVGFALNLLSATEQGEVALGGDSLTFSGQANSPEAYEKHLEAISNVPQGITLDDRLVPTVASPYRVKLEKNNEAVTISGFAPDTDTRSEIENLARQATPDTEIRNNLLIADGVPEGLDLTAAVQSSLEILENISQGAVEIVGNTLSLDGDASSSEGFLSLNRLLGGSLPGGLVAGATQVNAPEIRTYRWSVSKTGNGVKLNGNVPDIETGEQLSAFAKAQLQISELADQQAFARGQPAEFSDTAKLLIEQLAKLEAGQANLVGTRVYVTGRAGSQEAAKSVQAELSERLPKSYLSSTNIIFPDPEPSNVPVPEPAPEFVPPPPVADPYRFKVSKKPDDIRLSGNISEEAELEAITEDVKSIFNILDMVISLDLASGKPEGHDAARTLVLEQVVRLEAGEGNILGDRVFITGKAKTEALAKEIEAVLKSNLPAGYTSSTNIVFPEPEPVPPQANPYRWSVSKTDVGITLRGNVTDENDAGALLSIAQSVFGIRDVTDKQTIASGKPEKFDQVRRHLFNQVRKLEAGQGNIIANVASINGRAKSQTISEEIEKAFLDGLPEGFVGRTNIIFPEPKPEIPVADPFIWGARKTDEGITASGNVVSEVERQELVNVLKKTFNVQEVEDIQTIAVGKPEGFDNVRTLLIKQLKLLENGEAVISGNEVRLEGSIRNNNLLSLIERSMSSKVPDSYDVNLEVSAPQTTVIKGTNIEFKPRVDEETCQRLIVEAIAGRKILFETNRAIIQPNSQTILDDIIKAALECPDVRIEIGGHTDDRGRDEFNLELSEARADAVLDYMINNGVEISRLESRGYGETSPVVPNETASNRTLNRRIEFNTIK